MRAASTHRGDTAVPPLCHQHYTNGQRLNTGKANKKALCDTSSDTSCNDVEFSKLTATQGEWGVLTLAAEEGGVRSAWFNSNGLLIVRLHGKGCVARGIRQF
jgi:hypothetical protein